MKIFIYDAETEDFESKTSALSAKAGHYGGIIVADLDPTGEEDKNEMIIGSEAYMWVFTTEGQTDAPDLVINGDEITFPGILKLKNLMKMKTLTWM